jgi:NADH-quinone oxidoreductase subunit L
MSETTGKTLMFLLTAAWLLPLAGFVVEIYWLRLSHRLNKGAAYCAVGCIGAGFLCSLSALLFWGSQTGWSALTEPDHHGHAAHGSEHAGDSHDDQAADAEHPAQAEHGDSSKHASHPTKYATGTYYELARFGGLQISLDWYIDSLTLVMFTMVTFIATCIHLFAIGYMHDELTEEYEDHEVHLHNGGHFSRPGRFHRFFAYLSLFSFSMLGLVLAGNIFQVFIFWELVGLSSYLLIGFYIERKSASTAANKAFIMNRVGDFGFLIGMMILWTSFGTFQFGDRVDGAHAEAGLFTMVRGHDGKLDVSDDHKLVYLRDANGDRAEKNGKPLTISYLLLVAAGLGVFAGSIGKSAQFPLQTWLPDAMEGPTPVSALVHSATMVAAGVYLAGRFYPVFTPEVLVGIAYIGCITLFIAATIALVVTDIKRVLAYSTISQLGYMMLAIGVAGWGAALFHLITHAFFKSLMFLCSGSVIAGCHHVQDMSRMGGLRHKMKITAYTMLVGVIAIAGLAIPGTSIGLSGFYSKDAIVASALAYSELNPSHFLLFITPLVTAGITSFYMFRLWFLTFAGAPRDADVYDHCHESPSIMTTPLIVLAIFAAGCAWGGESGPLYRLITDSETVPAAERVTSQGSSRVTLPSHQGHESDVHKVHSMAGLLALASAFIGMGLAYMLYVQKAIDPHQMRTQFSSVYDFLVDKWRFDELYEAMFVAPVHVIASWCVTFDKLVLDGILHGAARMTIIAAKWDRLFDETFVDGIVNAVGTVTYAVGNSLKVVQTGRLRQYVMWIAVGVIVLFGALFTTIPR